jgi:hypothetical protein
MKLEKFEQEYTEEINKIKSLQFLSVKKKEFKFPAFQFLFKQALGIAFAMPAVALLFAFFFYPTKNVGDSNLSMLEDSNQRILSQINSLDE